jgi:soluble lytic murein transglycosylase-like protein
VASLKLAFAALALTSSAACWAESVADWRPYISEASLRFGVPTGWIERVMRVESGGQTRVAARPIRSRAGAMGLMQLMPGTWEMMRSTLALGPSPDDPRDNILAGTLYLRMMYDRFGYPGMFAAYNAGPGRFAAYLTTGKALPTETIAYQWKVVPMTSNVVRGPRNRAGETLFAVDQSTSAVLLKRPFERARAALFVVQNDAR